VIFMAAKMRKKRKTWIMKRGLVLLPAALDRIARFSGFTGCERDGTEGVFL